MILNGTGMSEGFASGRLHFWNQNTDINIKAAGREPYILVCDSPTPADITVFDTNYIKAFITNEGSAISHTAILARANKIPAVYGIDLISENFEGKQALVNGYTGEVFLEPCEEESIAFIDTCLLYERKREKLEFFRGKRCISCDGKEIALMANISSDNDICEVLHSDAEGIGLVRSELLFIGKGQLPCEDEQFCEYKMMASVMGAKKVIIRTFDWHDDKAEPRDMQPKEMREIIKCQLRAICRASAFGNISILLPMISDIEEIIVVKELLSDIKCELKNMSITYTADIKLGVMIETPKAVQKSSMLAKECDFICIGTNDLTGLMANTGRVSCGSRSGCGLKYESILREIELIVNNAHKVGKPAGICGELAADESMAHFFRRIGIDMISVVPDKVLAVRAALINDVES